MRAAVITEPGGPDVFAIREEPDPAFGPEEALVAVHATALNRADLLQRIGRYPGPPGTRDDLPGLEAAGTVLAVGERVSGWRPGDRVMALLGGGGYGSRVAVHERMLLPVPSSLDPEQAAAVPEVFLTAYDALVEQCGLQAGESALVHAVGSGVGTAAVQIAAQMGCRVFGTAGSGGKLERARELGLHVGIDYGERDFAEVVREETGGRGVDVVLDVVGGGYWRQNIASLALRGRMVVVGTLSGPRAELDLGPLMRKRLRVHGTVLRSRPLEQKAALTQAVARHLLPLFEAGRLRPVVDRVFPLAEVAAAHRYMESNQNFGKIVLSHEPPG